MKKAFPSFIKIGLGLVWAHRGLEFPGPEIFDTRYRDGGMWRLTTEQLQDDLELEDALGLPPMVTLALKIIAQIIVFSFGYLLAVLVSWGLTRFIL